MGIRVGGVVEKERSWVLGVVIVRERGVLGGFEIEVWEGPRSKWRCRRESG